MSTIFIILLKASDVIFKHESGRAMARIAKNGLLELTVPSKKTTVWLERVGDAKWSGHAFGYKLNAYMKDQVISIGYDNNDDGQLYLWDTVEKKEKAHREESKKADAWVVNYKGSPRLIYKVTMGKCQMLNPDLTKFPGTPSMETVKKLPVMKTFHAKTFNNGKYIKISGNNVISLNTGNKIVDVNILKMFK